MSLALKTSSFMRSSLPRVSACLYSNKAGEGTPKQPAQETQPKPAAPEPVKEAEVPSDNTKYQCERYLNHNVWSFYNIESEMTARRVGQPSSLSKPSA